MHKTCSAAEVVHIFVFCVREKLAHENLNGLDFRQSDPSAIRSYLTKLQQPYPQASSLPASLGAMEQIGCATVDIKGKPVSLICFKGDEIYHLYIGKRDCKSDCCDCPTPEYKQFAGKTAASWASEEQIFVLTSDKGTENALHELL